MTIRSTILAFALLSCTSSAWADWQLDNKQSELNFVSIKKGSIAEVHHFKAMTGEISNHGKAEIKLDLASIDSNIAIRDQRMKDHLFNTQVFSSAVITSQLQPSQLQQLNDNESKVMTVAFQLDLHGQQQTLKAKVRVTKMQQQLLVATVTPIIINAGDFALVNGIKKLAELAKLPSIGYAVPVTFDFTFNLQ